MRGRGALRSGSVAGAIVLGASVGLLAPLGVCAPKADAVVIKSAAGRISYLPVSQGPAAGLATRSPGAAGTLSATPSREPPLLYHGGPVMHSQAAYAIFWAPSGYAFPSGYQAAVEAFLQHVGADSGLPSNVYSVSAQYTDGNGHSTYEDSFAGSTTDTSAYPSSGSCAPYSGFGESFTACVTDAKLEAEVNAVIAAQGWPHGLGAEYYVLLPPQVGSCFEASGKECFDEQYCAYHSFSASPETVYASIGYSPGDPSGCGVGQYPNGHANGNADDTFSDLSHEANESITDPKLNAWYDKEGFEIGDECRNTPSGEDYGSPLGGSAGTLFNQSIDGAHYYLQQEWSNDASECVQRVAPAAPSIADPGEVVAGQSVSFDASGSSPGSGGIVSYAWDFGDGGTATGSNPTHTFAVTGTFTVTLMLKDDGGFAYSTSREVTVRPPHHTLSVSVTGPGSGTISADSGAISGCAAAAGSCSGLYDEGSTVTLTASPALHERVEWSGCTRPAANSCEVDIGSSDTEVSATFTPITHRLSVAAAGPGSGTISADSGAISGCAAAAGSCSGLYDEGSTVTLTASPALHERVEWSGCTRPAANSCEVDIGSSDTEVSATFTPITHRLSVAAAGPGSGTISADSGAISGCAAAAGSCSGLYDEGSTVTLTASPALHERVEWSGCTRPAANSCEVDIGSSDTEVSATFTPITHRLSVAAAGPGSGTISADSGAISGCAAAAGSCSGLYDEGSTVTLSPSPGLGSSFGGWSGGACTGAGNCVVTLAADTRVTATFEILAPAASVHKKKLRCRKGFRRRRVKGKPRCVKVHRKRPRFKEGSRKRYG